MGTSATRALTMAVAAKFADGSPVKHMPCFGSDRTFDRWKKWAADNGLIKKVKNRWFLQDVALSEFIGIGTPTSDASILRRKLLSPRKLAFISRLYLCVCLSKEIDTLTLTLTWSAPNRQKGQA